MKKEQKTAKKNFLNAFIKDEKGVYTIVMGGLSFILLGLMTVGFESSGLLLDKARLSDSLEQASLALTAENNEKRFDDYKLPDDAKIDARNKEIVLKYLEAYMPKANRAKGDIDAKDKSSAYEIDISSYKIKQEIGYDLTVTLPRTSLFPINILGTEVIPDEIRMGVDAKAVKFKESMIPIDLMIVADFSTSMRARPVDPRTGRYTSNDTKINILKRVVNTLAEQELFKKEEEDGVKNENRIAIATFSFGAQQFGDSNNKCVIPFIFNRPSEDDFYLLPPAYGEPLVSGGPPTYSNSKDYHWKRWDRAPENYIARIRKADQSLRDSIKNYGNSGRDSWADYLNILYKMPSEVYGLNIHETVKQIQDFDGKAVDYEKRYSGVKFDKNTLCMRYNKGLSISTTKNSKGIDTPWYDYANRNGFKSFMGTSIHNGIQPGGSTLVSAGLLVGANAILNDPNKKAQRILLVLSDGDDAISSPDKDEEKEYGEMTDNLIYGKKEDGTLPRYNENYAMCKKIRERVDMPKIYGKDDPKIPSKIAFVAFGTKPKKEAAWKYCVGKGNYFEAHSEKELLNAFKQAIGVPEEVGFSK